MPLRNRVTPFGELITTDARGLFMGNRGCLHDDRRNIVRSAATTRWITCRLEFKGRRRTPLMQPGLYTELFFLDEATALAAGHRPCAECRRADFDRFRSLFPQAAGEPAPMAGAMDHVLDHERRNGRSRRTWRALPSGCPDGTMIVIDGDPALVHVGRFHHWTPHGYEPIATAAGPEAVEVLTPPSTVAVLRAGYRPVVHATANS
jgi:hypothetical protein